MSVEPNGTGAGGMSGVAPVSRRHASDEVFRQLATQVRNRHLPAGTALPPERELAARFDVSRIVVREAVHRLKEYELVRVRQGSPTQVLDPNDAKDMRLIGLEIELMPNSADSTRAFRERMVYAGAALLDLAEQRMSDAELDELERLVGECLATAQEPTKELSNERAYWTKIAAATRKRIYLLETGWYFNLMQRQPRFIGWHESTSAMRAALH